LILKNHLVTVNPQAYLHQLLSTFMLTQLSQTPEDGMKMDTFLSHAQRLITNQLNAYIQDPADADGVDAVKVANIGADGKLFKKFMGTNQLDGSSVSLRRD